MGTLKIGTLFAVVLALISQVGCEPGPPGPGQDSSRLRPADLPGWADKQNWSQNGRRYFVGRATADHPLDEKNALDEALDRAIQNIAKAAGSGVKARTEWTQHERGDAKLGNINKVQQRNIKGELNVAGLVSDIQQDEVYWDRIKVSLFTYQYRYFVLVSIADENYKDLVEQIKKKKS